MKDSTTPAIFRKDADYLYVVVPLVTGGGEKKE
jgi:hypothetical protein